MSRKPEVLPNPRRQGLLSGPAFVAAMVAIAALLFFVAWRALPATFVLEMGVLLVVLAAAMAGLSVGVLLMRWQQRRALDILRAGVLEAQEGNLHPVSVPAVADNYQRALFDEYNRMMSALGRMFTFVEECQNKYLHERNKMNVIVQGVPVALMTVDDNVVVTTANRQAEGLFEVPPQGLVGRDLFSLLPLNESDRDVLRDAFLYKQNVRNRVIRIPLGGMDHWLTTNLSFITERESDMAAVITLLDITDYRSLQESAYNREKLVAMGQLAAGVAHELNTPLGSILGFSQLLPQVLDDRERVDQYAQKISDEARRCSRIVGNLLNLARKEHCQGDRCEVNAMIREIVDTLVVCRLKRYNIEVDCVLDESDPIADGGCGEIEIVLTNLLINAIQAMGDAPSPRITVRTRLEGDWVVIVVEDNGPGVSPEIRSRIFEPFFTTKDVGEGSGLGLSICYAMITRRGGSIRCDPEYAGGARFVIKFPALISETSKPETA